LIKVSQEGGISSVVVKEFGGVSDVETGEEERKDDIF
jgi:hypothetical protein